MKFSGDRSFWEDFLVGLCKCGLMQRIALKFGKYKNLYKSNDFVDKIVRFVYNIIEKRGFSF